MRADSRAARSSRPLSVLPFGTRSTALVNTLSIRGDVALAGPTTSAAPFDSRFPDVDIVLVDGAAGADPLAELASRVRGDTLLAPVVVLFSDTRPDRAAALLDMGADDVLVEGCTTDEILLRLHVARHRALVIASSREDRTSVDRSLDSDASPSELPRASLDVRTRVMASGNERVLLTRRECAFAEVMARRPGVAVSRGELLQAIWGREYRKTSRTNPVDVYARFVRQRLDSIGLGAALVTVRYVGYRLDASVTVHHA